MKKILPRAVVVILALSLFLPIPAQALEIVRIATLNWEPYVGEKLPDDGFSAEIVREAFKRVGYQVQYTYVPWKRAVGEAEKGNFDGYFPAYWTKAREEKSVFTDSFVDGPLGFFKRTSSAISYSRLEDLKPYKIGVVRGYANTPEFDEAGYLRKDVVNSDLQNIKKLLGERIDLFVADKFVGLHLLQKELPEQVGQIGFISPPLQQKKLYVCISKNTSNYEQKVMAFNEGLQQIVADGTLDSILRKYGF